MSVTAPTQETLLEEDGLNSVHREADDSWRHGCYITNVFHRVSDDTYWSVSYSLSTDCECNGLRDGQYDIVRVVPREKMVIWYVAADPQTGEVS